MSDWAIEVWRFVKMDFVNGWVECLRLLLSLCNLFRFHSNEPIKVDNKGRSIFVFKKKKRWQRNASGSSIAVQKIQLHLKLDVLVNSTRLKRPNHDSSSRIIPRSCFSLYESAACAVIHDSSRGSCDFLAMDREHLVSQSSFEEQGGLS